MARGTQGSWGWLSRFRRPLSSWLGLRASNRVSAGATTGSLVFATLWSLYVPCFPCRPSPGWVKDPLGFGCCIGSLILSLSKDQGERQP